MTHCGNIGAADIYKKFKNHRKHRLLPAIAAGNTRFPACSVKNNPRNHEGFNNDEKRCKKRINAITGPH